MNWISSSLGEILPLQYGKSLPASKRIEGNIPVYSSAGSTGTHNESLVSGPCLIVGRKGTVGSVYYEEHDCFPIDTAFYTTGTPEIDIRFGYYLLLHKRLSNYSQDSAVPGLNRDRYSEIPVLVPLLSEQRAIAEVLGALDDKIAANNKVIQLADSFTEAIAEKAFSSGKLVPLASIADITMGNSPKGETLNELGDGVPFFQGIRDFGVRYPEVRVSTTAPTRFANELDTLFSVRAPVGTSNLAGFSCSIGRGISAFSSRTETPYALFQAVRISKVWERYNAEGTVFGSINRKQLEQSEIKWVDGSRLQELESTLSNVENILHAATSMNTTLAATRDALLPQLMSGKMRVREAEAVVEDVP